ncbi:cardiolipin synthetase [compost metagenome]
MFDKAPIDKLSQDFVQDMKDSKPILLKEFERRSVRQKGAEMFAHLISPLL